MTRRSGYRRSRESGNPVSVDGRRWVPACAGTTGVLQKASLISVISVGALRERSARAVHNPRNQKEAAHEARTYAHLRAALERGMACRVRQVRASAPTATSAESGSPEGRGSRRQRRSQAARRRGVRVRVSAGADRRHAPGEYGERAGQHVCAQARCCGCVVGRCESECRFSLFAGVARPVEGAGAALGAGHEGTLLPDRAARCVDQRGHLDRQAHDRNREA